MRQHGTVGKIQAEESEYNLNFGFTSFAGKSLNLTEPVFSFVKTSDNTYEIIVTIIICLYIIGL